MGNHVAAQLMTLELRPARPLRLESPVIAVNQPAHIRVDTRRYDTLDTNRVLIRSTKRRPRRRLRPPLHLAHLTKPISYQDSATRPFVVAVTAAVLSADGKVRAGRMEKTVLLGELALDGATGQFMFSSRPLSRRSKYNA